jgi:hypothetical protein
MNYAVEMDSGAMIYITKFYKYWHSKVDTDTDRKVNS